MCLVQSQAALDTFIHSSQKVHKAINLIYSSKLFLLISCVLSGLISTGMKLVVLKEVITGNKFVFVFFFFFSLRSCVD